MVTRTFLPPQEEYLQWVRQALDSHVLTNNGPIHKKLEEALRLRLGADHLLLTSNGTIALQLAIRTFGIKGKVITTPFSYVATVSSILWEGCIPVFADIDPNTCCIDPACIEELIDKDTTAILATHVYGIPCDVEAIEAIALRYGLKVIYDGAHAFGTLYKGKSLTSYGDACTLSFHATKLFHTVEGGAVVLHSEAHEKKMRLQRSFGHIGDEHYELGINGKMSEMHAAMGMAVLPHIEVVIRDRKRISGSYDEQISGLDLCRPVIPENTKYNYSYYPILFADESRLMKAMKGMAEMDVHTRRYFYPSLNQLPYVERTSTPVSEQIATRVLCLPLYAGLDESGIERVMTSLRNSLV